MQKLEPPLVSIKLYTAGQCRLQEKALHDTDLCHLHKRAVSFLLQDIAQHSNAFYCINRNAASISRLVDLLCAPGHQVDASALDVQASCLEHVQDGPGAKLKDLIFVKPVRSGVQQNLRRPPVVSHRIVCLQFTLQNTVVGHPPTLPIC